MAPTNHKWGMSQPSQACVEGWSGNTNGPCFTIPEVHAGLPPPVGRSFLQTGWDELPSRAPPARERGPLYVVSWAFQFSWSSAGGSGHLAGSETVRVGHPIIRHVLDGPMCKGVHSVQPMVVIPPVHAKVLGDRAGSGWSLARLRDSPWGWTKQPLTGARGAPPGARIRHNVRLGPAQSPLRHWAAREPPAISAAFLHDAQHAEHAQLPPRPDGRGQAKPKSHPRTWRPPTARRVKPSGRWINPQQASLGPGHEWWRRRRHLKEGRRRHLRNNPPAATIAPWHPPRTLAGHVLPTFPGVPNAGEVVRPQPNTCQAGSHIAGTSRSISRRRG